MLVFFFTAHLFLDSNLSQMPLLSLFRAPSSSTNHLYLPPKDLGARHRVVTTSSELILLVVDPRAAGNLLLIRKIAIIPSIIATRHTLASLRTICL